MRLKSATFALAISLATTLGCASQAGGSGPALHANEARVVPVEVRDADFAPSLHKVLRDGSHDNARTALLVGVVRRQLAHAAERFAAGHTDRGTDSVVGALYLLRTGEGRSEMIDAAGEKALAGAIERFSARGDEGRAKALMLMRAAALPSGAPARRELDEHLAALDRWVRDTRERGGPMAKLGAAERAGVARALIDPTDQAIAEATEAVARWIDRAIEYNVEFRQTGRRPDRDEAIEASRALESGGVTMAALLLRHGSAARALEHIDKSGARRVIRPQLYERIRAAAANDGGGDWLGLAAILARHDSEEDEDAELGVDATLLAAGLWGTALEAYRRNPSQPDAAVLVASSLVRFGMPEAAPLVLADAAGAKPSAALLSTSLQLLAEAMQRDADADDFGSARRTFLAAQPLVVLAEQADVKRRVDPSASRVRYMMATIEVRSGDLERARAQLEAAVTGEPTVAGHTLLATVQRQLGRSDEALASVDRALSAPDAKQSLLDLADAHVLAFEVHRERGANDQAKGSLDGALAAVLAARDQRGPLTTKMRAERLLARVLDGYGDAKGAARAIERALSLAASDRPTLGATMLEAVGRALVRHDLSAARAALKRGLEGDAPDEDLVYGGLWLRLLERELQVTTDGTADRAMRVGTSRTSWTAKLAAWASGRMSDAELGTAAQSASQKVEALFYTAMGRKIAGDPAATERLRDVVKSPVMDLLEVQLAREILAPRLRAAVPGDARIP